MKNIITIELIRPTFKLYSTPEERERQIYEISRNIAVQICMQEEHRMQEEYNKQWKILNSQLEKLTELNRDKQQRNNKDD
jgi:uncharacterized protein YcbK (DUF882 family)